MNTKQMIDRNGVEHFRNIYRAACNRENSRKEWAHWEACPCPEWMSEEDREFFAPNTKWKSPRTVQALWMLRKQSQLLAVCSEPAAQSKSTGRL